jgi:Raf kinase inhibitor-like YbhB/YbcL family protein
MTRIARVCLILILLAAVCLAGCGPAATPGPAPPVEEPTSAPAPTAPAEEPTAAPSPVPPTATPRAPEVEPAPTSTPIPPLQVYSSTFDPGGEIPVQYTCHGANLSPPLEWSGVPQGAQSLALVMDDPDSQPPGFVHWVIYNIPATATGLPEGVPATPSLPDGARQGANDYAPLAEEGQTFPRGAPINRVGYDGPCPPGAHRYVFKLYALDAVLDLLPESTRAELVAVMEGHVLGEVELAGVFTPPQP